MDADKINKITYVVNTSLLGIVVFLMWFFYVCHATFLVYFSIPTICVYLIGYYIIHKRRLYYYVMMIYIWITIYMCLTVVCLGYNYGFQLYPLSMIPIIYYINYLAYKFNLKRVSSAVIVAGIIICYLGGTVYVLINGPVYEGNSTLSVIACCANSIYVFGLLILYTKTIMKTIISSEEKLKQMSYIDELTGLFNRHYMVSELEEAMKVEDSEAVAIIDIDDFKKINDEYGHNAGDYVLRKVSEVMQENCENAIISRWGGEEFLLIMNKQDDYFQQMEMLRGAVEQTTFEFEEQMIQVSVTIGLSERKNITSVNKWVQAADDKLYTGKRSGKNVVIA